MPHSEPKKLAPLEATATTSGWFPSTHWSVVLAAGQSSNPAAQVALQRLCQSYWYPLYAYVRRRGYSPEDAQDLTQGFFQRLLERNLLADLMPAGARFRSYLLQALKNHLATEWTRAHAGKRGGTQSPLSLDELAAEARYEQEASDPATPEVIFDRRWASTLLQKALERLREEQIASGKEHMFEAMVNCLTGAAPAAAYSRIALHLGMSEAAVKMAIHRLRKRYGEFLRLEVAQTVITPAEVDQELRYLLSVLASK